MMEQITSRQNTLLTRLVRLQNSKKYRQEQGLFVGDGTKLLEEAIRWAPEQLRAVVLQEGVECPQLPEHVRAVQVPRQLMGQISQMEAPEGALFLAELPERKEAVVTPGCLVLDGIQVKRPRCQEAAQQGYANATELADYLVAKGVPFREAHHIVGEAVVEAIRQGKPLEDLPLSELQKFSQVIDEDVYPILSLQSCLDKRAAKGGVSPQQVAQAIAFAQARLG